MKTISLLHPFSARAIGLKESDLVLSHSKPHVLALQAIKELDDKFEFSIDYFTGSFFKKEKEVNGVLKRFWPISEPIFKRHQWRNQFSKAHYNFYNTTKIPDITIINMSGHGSKYVFKLAKRIKEKNKNYIAMVGGMHMTYTGSALAYYKDAHHIIVHTQYQKGKLQENEDFEKLDIRVLPLGIDTSVFLPSSDFKENDEINLLYVGRISRLKQIEIAIHTIHFLKVRSISNIKLLVVGPKSDSQYLNELMNLVNQLDLINNVVFVGAVPHSELIQYYQRAQLLFLPSKHESFGMVMTEAMACGVPVVALKGAGGPDEIITNDQDGILTSEELYSEAVFQLLTNDEKFKVMKNEARAKIEKKFSLNRTIEILKNSLESVL